MTRPNLQPAVDAIVANLLVGRSAADLEIPILRRDVRRECDRAVWRALWRAERRTRRRKLPEHIAHSAPWVNAQRRRMAHEISKHLLSLGAGRELVNAVATIACEAFPRDGIVYEDQRRRPRARGTSPRQLGDNPRARGSSPRQRGTSPRDRRRAPADFSQGDSARPPASIAAAAPARSGLPANEIPRADRTVDELAPGWTSLKESIAGDLHPHERQSARKRIQDDAKRLSEARSRRDPSSPST